MNKIVREKEDETPRRSLTLMVEKSVMHEYEAVFSATMIIRKELALLCEQYMRDRLARHKIKLKKGSVQ